MKAIQITVDDRLLARLDRDPEVKQFGRSAVFRRAAEAYLRRRGKARVAEAYRRAYGRGGAEGLKTESAVNLDHVQTVERDRLARYVGSLKAETMRAVCRALAVATACGD